MPSFPAGSMVAAVSGTATAAWRTCGSRASWRAKAGEYAGAVNGCTTRSDGFVLARNFG